MCERHIEIINDSISLLDKKDREILRLRNVIVDLVICPAFRGEVFEKDKESHRAWTLARLALQKTTLPTQEESADA